MDTLRKSMTEYASKFQQAGFGSENSCFAVRINGQIFMLASVTENGTVTPKDVKIVVSDDFESAEALRDKAVFFYDLFLKRKDLWSIGIFKSENAFFLCEKGKTIPPILDDMCQILATHIETVDGLCAPQVLRALKGENACQVKHVGAIVGGRSLDELFAEALVLEKSAECYILAKSIGGAKHLSKFRADIEHKIFKSVYSVTNQKMQRIAEGINEYAGGRKSESESEEVDGKRVLLLDTLKKMSADGLVQGTWGNVSVRLNSSEMLCSPKGIGYNILKPQDMAVVNCKTLESRGEYAATSEKGIHAAVLSGNSKFNAVIHAHPYFASVFAAAQKDLEIENAEDKKLLGDVVRSTRHALPGTKDLTFQTVKTLGNGKAVFLANHGVVVAGEDMDTAYRALSRLEEICKEKFKNCNKDSLIH